MSVEDEFEALRLPTRSGHGQNGVHRGIAVENEHYRELGLDACPAGLALDGLRVLCVDTRFHQFVARGLAGGLLRESNLDSGYRASRLDIFSVAFGNDISRCEATGSQRCPLVLPSIGRDRPDVREERYLRFRELRKVCFRPIADLILAVSNLAFC